MADKIIRATITVELPYSNELLNDGRKLDKELRRVIKNADFIPHETQAGTLDYCKRPVIRDETTL
jgi:hypothetical protein